MDCPEIKDEPEFCQMYPLSHRRLFEDHLDTIVELIEWMLMPKQIIKRKKINPNKTKLEAYPFQCK
jgi:hypothetical protein